MLDSLWPHGLQHAKPPYPSPSPGACSNSCLLRRWCHPTIWPSVVPFFSCLLSFPASGSFPMSLHFISGGQSIGASVSVLLMNIQAWFPLGLTDLISLLSSSVAKSCPVLCNSMDCSTPGCLALHYLLEFTQTRVRWVCDAIQPSPSLLPLSHFAFNLSQQQGLF